MNKIKLILISMAFTPLFIFSNEVVVTKVSVDCHKKNTQTKICDFSTTLRHDDSGWTHYANRWEVLSMDGEILATRTLHHPHDNEQPFTRSLRNVLLPQDLKRVRVRGNDSLHGLGEAVEVVLPIK